MNVILITLECILFFYRRKLSELDERLVQSVSTRLSSSVRSLTSSVSLTWKIHSNISKRDN